MKEIKKKLRTLFSNIKFMSSHKLNEEFILEACLNSGIELKYILDNLAVPQILSPMDSIRLMQEEPRSLCRFGDGELNIINGGDIPFQKYDKKLAERLQYLLGGSDSRFHIAIPYYYFSDTRLCTETCRTFIRTRRFLAQQVASLCNLERTYLATDITQMYQTYEKFDFEGYFNEAKKLFENKKVVLVHGEHILDKLLFNLLERVSEISYVIAPSKNAYSFEANLIEEIKTKFSQNYLVCVILGPAAKSLVYELTLAGYIAWDIGHWLKDYDSYKKNIPRSCNEVLRFFQPD